MGGLYKIFTKVLANSLQKYLPKLIHPAQYDFIAGKNILHNVLNVQMTMDYARNTHNTGQFETGNMFNFENCL